MVQENYIPVIKAKKKILFVSCNGLKKIREGRSVKIFFLHYFFGQKCVLCIGCRSINTTSCNLI